MNWTNFTPTDFEYDFERDELAAHRVTLRKRLNASSQTLKFEETSVIVIATSSAAKPLEAAAQDHLSTQISKCGSDNHRMASMKKRSTRNGEAKIDSKVIAQAGDESAWGKSVRAHGKLLKCKRSGVEHRSK